MDELDEFNEAPHIVHGDVMFSPSLSTDLHRSGEAIDDRLRELDDDTNSLDMNVGINIDLLDDDDEDIVLSTDDLLLGGGGLPGAAQHNFNHQLPTQNHRRVGGGNATGMMHINGDSIKLNKNNSNNLLT